jgi:uncharacterized membrane protein YfcA
VFAGGGLTAYWCRAYRVITEGSRLIDLLFTAPGVTHWTFLGLSVLPFFTTAFGIAAGLGGGVMLLGVMATIFPPAALIPLHGTVQLGANITRVAIMRRHIVAGYIPAFAVGAVAGGIAGGQLVVTLPTALLQLVLGLFLLYVCWAPTPSAMRAYSGRRFFVLGVVGSLASMFVGASGSLLAPFVAAASPSRHEFVATHAALMTTVHGLKIVVFGALGFAFGAYVPLLVSMIVMTFFGNLFGRSVLNRLPEAVFRRIFQLVLTLLSLRLLFAGLSGL